MQISLREVSLWNETDCRLRDMHVEPDDMPEEPLMRVEQLLQQDRRSLPG